MNTVLIIQNVNPDHKKTLGMGTIVRKMPKGAMVRPHKGYYAPVLREKADQLEMGKDSFFVSSDSSKEVYYTLLS